MKKIKKIKKNLKKIRKKQPKLKFIYAWYYKHSKVNEKQILLESFHGKDISDSSFAILKEFLKRPDSYDYKIYFATTQKEAHSNKLKKMGLTQVNLVDITTFEYVKVLATSKYLINNSSFPVYFIKRPEQIYLQTWHGTPLKTLGKEMRFGIESMYNIQHNFMQADYLMFPNEFTKEVMMRDYNLEKLYTGKVVYNGYPRNTVFSDEKRGNKVKKQLGDENYTTFAYMPTWRGQSNHSVQTDNYEEETKKMLTYLDSQLQDNQKMYVNFHPILQGSIVLDCYEHIYPFPDNVEKYDFLNSIDVLITDYSSVFFDYSITGKPIILFMYDYEEYMYDRGMYMNVKELPFCKIYDVKALANCIKEKIYLSEEYDYKKNISYIKKFLPYDSLENTKNMVNLVFDQQENNLSILNYNENTKKRWNIRFYPNVKTETGIQTVLDTVDEENDIVLFEKKFFGPELSSYLYDNCKSNLQYIFITKTLPRTFIEEYCSKKKKATVNKILLQRELKRVFPNLNVNPIMIDECYTGIPGHQYYKKETDFVKSELKIDNNQLILKVENIDTISSFMIINQSKHILWKRALTQEELHSGLIKEDFNDIMNAESLNKGGKYLLALETNEKQPVLIEHVDYPYYRKKIKQHSVWKFFEPLKFNSVNLKKDNKNKNDIENQLIPYLFRNRFLGIWVENSQTLFSKNVKGKVSYFKIDGTVLKLKIKLNSLPNPITDVVLSYRSSVEEIEYSFDYTVNTSENQVIIDAKLDLKNKYMQELFWDVIVKTTYKNVSLNISNYLNRRQKLNLMIMNQQMNISDNNILFPYKTMGGKLAYTYREKTPYDGWNTKIKEFLACFIFAILHPYWKRKKMWLVYEKFCSMAQDNGYYFFKYCMEELPQNEREKIFYILDENSTDWDKVKKYEKQVIPFMSFKHILYTMVAKMYIASDSKKHLYIWRAKPNFVSQRISKHKILFLQHGVTALKKVDGIFGKKGSSPMTYFTTTSEFEQNIVVENFKYKKVNAPILGFTRWDVLENTATDTEKIILAMPTWRSWLEEKSADDFVKSDYYHNYMKLLSSNYLAEILKKNNVKLIFYIHPKFRDYIGEFNVSGEHIELIPFGSEPLNEIIKKCHMLITDYSSVCWDVYYLGKPVLFYQFDYDMYEQAHGSYLDMEQELFGKRYTKYEDLLLGIEKQIKNNFTEEQKYKDLRNHYFAYIDNENSKRTYQYISSKSNLL